LIERPVQTLENTIASIPEEPQRMTSQGNRILPRGLVELGLGCFLGLIAIAAPSRAGDVFVATPLATNATDSQLVNPWGISASGTGEFWISDNGAGVSTQYSVGPATNLATKLSVPSATGVVIPDAGSVTGIAFNGGSGFNGDRFLFVSEDGTISGWRDSLGSNAERLQLPDPTNVYKGVTLDTTGGHSYLLAANFHTGKIDVFKGDPGAPDLLGKFVDPGLSNGFAPFNISKLGNTIYVTYALQAANGKDDSPGPGNGFVTAFDENGSFLGRIANGGKLDSPWGLAIAPSGFGSLAGDLLVGNFGDGTINIFSADPNSPASLGQLTDANTGNALSIDGLWGLIAGNGGDAGNIHDIYFTAGPNGKSGGVLGVLHSVPEPSSAVLALISLGTVSVGWTWKKNRRRRATGRLLT
jgi:uncharacterized protein (TIGR03118 family)